MQEPTLERPIASAFILSTWSHVKRWIAGCCAAVFFGLAILAMSFLTATNPSAAEDTALPVTITPTQAPQVEYYLPYPGILPDSPIYKLKALRDKWRLMTIFDPAKKASQELFYADKRINAAIALIDGGQAKLGVTTVSKAEKYLEQSANHALELSRTGRDVKSLLLSLEQAAAKHEELIQGMTQKVTGTHSQELEGILKTTRMVQENVTQALMEN